ncbi:MAG: DUF262 domain-containing protein [Rikenellaceae bacterium]
MSVRSNDTNLSDLLNDVSSAKAQLPEFQRSWVWSDAKIKKLIESISSGFPMGAVMFLECGGDARFKYRKFEGVDKNIERTPDWLVLDGQQRLTTLSQVFFNKSAVQTQTDTGKAIQRYYYLNIRKAIDPDVDIIDAIESVSEKKIKTENIGRREVILNLSTQENEFAQLMYPLNIIFSTSEATRWSRRFSSYYRSSSDCEELEDMFDLFNETILEQVRSYKLPVISLTKETPKEAVCQIFENVNTGGVPLTVFELVTAMFAADEFNLREDWESIKETFKSRKDDILTSVDGAQFLMAMTLLTTYKKNLNVKSAVSCKKKDVLKLKLGDYTSCRDALVQGYEKAANFLVHQGVYTSRDIPYTSQLIPLSVIFAIDSERNNKLMVNNAMLSNWYWCGIFGELYGGANETRFALDIVDMFSWINGGNEPDTVIKSNFQTTRLLSMYTRNSAAYKGVMALILKGMPLDFVTAENMNTATYLQEGTDIHHIFPQKYCIDNNLPEKMWNSVINKSMIYATTNRSIGGRAPSDYIRIIRDKIHNNKVQDRVAEAIATHKINYELLVTDQFYEFIVDRAIQLLDMIEGATGKRISGRDSEETIKAFETKLINN